MSTTFETAKVGDRVWSVELGWGEVFSLYESETYPINVVWKNRTCASYTLEGKRWINHVSRTLFWDEVVIDAPAKPLPVLVTDTKVIVWTGSTPKTKRYFSHFNSSGEIECFVNGMTSWTTKQTMDWPYWELPE